MGTVTSSGTVLTASRVFVLPAGGMMVPGGFGQFPAGTSGYWAYGDQTAGQCGRGRVTAVSGDTITIQPSAVRLDESRLPRHDHCAHRQHAVFLGFGASASKSSIKVVHSSRPPGPAGSDGTDADRLQGPRSFDRSAWTLRGLLRGVLGSPGSQAAPESYRGHHAAGPRHRHQR